MQVAQVSERLDRLAVRTPSGIEAALVEQDRNPVGNPGSSGSTWGTDAGTLPSTWTPDTRQRRSRMPARTVLVVTTASLFRTIAPSTARPGNAASAEDSVRRRGAP